MDFELDEWWLRINCDTVFHDQCLFNHVNRDNIYHTDQSECPRRSGPGSANDRFPYCGGATREEAPVATRCA